MHLGSFQAFSKLCQFWHVCAGINDFCPAHITVFADFGGYIENNNNESVTVLPRCHYLVAIVVRFAF